MPRANSSPSIVSAYKNKKKRGSPKKKSAVAKAKVAKAAKAVAAPVAVVAKAVAEKVVRAELKKEHVPAPAPVVAKLSKAVVADVKKVVPAALEKGAVAVQKALDAKGVSAPKAAVKKVLASAVKAVASKKKMPAAIKAMSPSLAALFKKHADIIMFASVKNPTLRAALRKGSNPGRKKKAATKAPVTLNSVAKSAGLVKMDFGWVFLPKDGVPTATVRKLKKLGHVYTLFSGINPNDSSYFHTEFYVAAPKSATGRSVANAMAKAEAKRSKHKTIVVLKYDAATKGNRPFVYRRATGTGEFKRLLLNGKGSAKPRLFKSGNALHNYLARFSAPVNNKPLVWNRAKLAHQ